MDLTMPRFSVRTKMAAKELELFHFLGAGEVFSGRAELSKITDSGPLAISDVIHESVLEITKDGTGGAAATGVELVFFSSSVEDTNNTKPCCQQTFHLHSPGRARLNIYVWFHNA